MSLTDKIEQASEGSRELDAEIWRELFGAYVAPAAPRFTTSLDAAVQLVPKGWNWMAGERNQGRCRAYVNNNQTHFIGPGAAPNPACIWHEVVAATPALALCSAALRAQERERDG